MKMRTLLKPSAFIFPFLLFLIVAYVALWPISTLQHPLKWDATHQYYPWKYFIGECLQQGILPLWNPYQLLGSPIHADPNCGAWYPLTWVWGYFFGYDIYILSLDYLFHLVLAGLGMYYLAKTLAISRNTALCLGCAYMLSGFFIGNAQHLTWIVAGTWIPYIIGSFIEIHENRGWASIVKMAVFCYMLFSGGYPAFYLILFYFLLCLFLFFLIRLLLRKEYDRAIRWSGRLSIAVLLTALLSSAPLISLYRIMPVMSRGAGVTLDQSLFGPFSPQCLMSLLFPFATVSEIPFFQTDLAMTNAYWGILPLLYFSISLLLRRTPLVNFFLVMGLLLLMASMGGYLPVRIYLYHFLPGMDLFRFPSLFRIFWILCFLIVSGYAMDRWLEDDGKTHKRGILVICVFVVLVLFVVAWTIPKAASQFGDFLHQNFPVPSFQSKIAQHLLFQCCIQLVLLASFAFFWIKQKKVKGLSSGLLLGMVVADLILTSLLNAPYTAYHAQYRSVDIKRYSDQFPKGFPLPENEAILKNQDGGTASFQVLATNLNIFQKRISYMGYNPFQLKGFEELSNRYPRLLEKTLNNGIVFLTGKVYPEASISELEGQGHQESRRIYIAGDNRHPDFLSSSATQADSWVQITSFSPNELTAQYVSSLKQQLVLLQNNYHGWEAILDGQPVGITTANRTLISISAPAGSHQVVFRYRPGDVIAGFYITAITLFLCLSAVAFDLISFRFGRILPISISGRIRL